MTTGTTIQMDAAWADKLATFARDIKISHTIFAMPFALLSAFLAAEGWLGTGKFLLIVACMITARTVAMAANRLLDARLDRLNPRTATRAIPSGRLSAAFYVGALVLCACLFIAATAGFWFWFDNRWPLVWSVPVLLFLSAYPLLKRFTRLCHYYLGAALALAPVCAWVAVSGGIDWAPLLMAGAVLMWTAGFDIIYACQDYHSDLQTGVISVPAKLGIGPALWVARMTHVICVAMLIALGWWSASLGSLYFVGVGAAVLLLIIEHGMVKANDLSKVGLAFFTMNGVISVVLGTLGILDTLM